MIGSRLGPWLLERELGRGGMACVYLARHQDSNQEAAIKVLAAELASDPGFRQRFEREIDALRLLDHPHIVRFLESGDQDGRYYFAMEYVSGSSLHDILEDRGRIPWREVLAMALQIAPALKHAHDRGIIHRDLKPSNLLRADGVEPLLIKLTDFGIASLFARPHLTVPGGIIGTAEFLSPEQASGKPVTPRSDLYSLGVVLYALLTGRPPFLGEVVDLLHKHCFAQFDRPIRLVPEIPHDLDQIVCDLLEKDPKKRPADGGVLQRRLENLQRRLNRKEASTAENLYPRPGSPINLSGHEGPATMVSRVVREELERQNRGGPVQQFFNHPLVIILGFLVTLSLLIWTFWPANPEALFQQGASLMASDDPEDWDRGWTEFLEPLAQRHPEFRAEEVAGFRQRVEDRASEREAARKARHAGPMTEAQWAYQEGIRLRQLGEKELARGKWLALVAAFKDIASEGPWVRLAQERLAEENKPIDRQWRPVMQARERALHLRAAGKIAEAEDIEKALHTLYRGDTAALDKIK